MNKEQILNMIDQKINDIDWDSALNKNDEILLRSFAKATENLRNEIENDNEKCAEDNMETWINEKIKEYQDYILDNYDKL